MADTGPADEPRTEAGRARMVRVIEWAGDHEQVIEAELDEILAIEREAAAPPTGLDVERLARAYHNSTCDCDSFDSSADMKRDIWPVVAAEYVRLGEPPTTLDGADA